MEPLTLALFVIGLIILIIGAELLVRGASRLAVGFGISPLVVGLTVVAFGTSSPELAVSVGSALSGQADIALGNVVGSNIFNVLFILGVSALIGALVVAQQLIRLDVPLMIGVSFLLLLLGLDGKLGRLDGLLLFAGIVAYTAFAIRQSRKESGAVRDEYDHGIRARAGRMWAAASAAQHRLCDRRAGAVGARRALAGGRRGESGADVGAERVDHRPDDHRGRHLAARSRHLDHRQPARERDIAVGNVVGSNIFNILAVLGLSAVVAPSGVAVQQAALRFDIPFMIAVAVACLPIFFTGNRIARWEGALFLAYYVAYTLYLILDAARHDALPAYSTVLLEFAVPLTALTLGVLAVRAWRAGRSAKSGNVDSGTTTG